MVRVKCNICNVVVIRKPSAIKVGRVFCSQKCYAISSKKERHCVVCGNRITTRNKTCGRACSNKLRIGTLYKLHPTRISLKLQLTEVHGYKCSICKNSGEWLGAPLVLHMDHINGDRQDNDFNNLRILCPNCHSQTETYGGKNIKRKKFGESSNR